MLGTQIFIHGGISEESEFLSDSHLMNTSPNNWSPCTLINNGPALAWHAACLVLPHEIANHPRVNIYKFAEEKSGRRSVVKVRN